MVTVIKEDPAAILRLRSLQGMPRSSFYYQPTAPDAFTVEVMHAIDRIRKTL